MNTSLTITGLLVIVLGKLAQTSGWQGETVTEENLLTIVHAAGTVAQIGGILLAWFGRVRKGDITWFGSRKTPNITIDSLPQ